MKSRVFITGVTGQDGFILSKYLLEECENYIVYGLIRRVSNHNERIDELEKLGVEIVEGDITDLSSLIRSLKIIRPDFIYGFAAQSHVRKSFEEPISTFNITAGGVINCLEAIRTIDKNIRYYQSSSSEQFGKAQEIPQKETTIFYPRSPYSCSKVFGYWITKNYRESYGIFASNGILFNHESEYRGINFVTRKITDGVAKIKYGLIDKLELGNLDSERDWMYAKDAVIGAKLILEHTEPDDFILCSGEKHSVREFCDICFKKVGLGDYKKYVISNPKYMRPAEVDVLIGDYTKAKNKLNWKPKTSFEEMVDIMLKYDLKKYENKGK